MEKLDFFRIAKFYIPGNATYLSVQAQFKEVKSNERNTFLFSVNDAEDAMGAADDQIQEVEAVEAERR